MSRWIQSNGQHANMRGEIRVDIAEEQDRHCRSDARLGRRALIRCPSLLHQRCPAFACHYRFPQSPSLQIYRQATDRPASCRSIGSVTGGVVEVEASFGSWGDSIRVRPCPSRALDAPPSPSRWLRYPGAHEAVRKLRRLELRGPDMPHIRRSLLQLRRNLPASRTDDEDRFALFGQAWSRWRSCGSFRPSSSFPPSSSWNVTRPPATERTSAVRLFTSPSPAS